MAQSKKLDSTVLILAVVGSLVLLNVVGLFVFGRLDLTDDKQFTLSEATKKTLAALDEPVTVRAYFSADVPPAAAAISRYVRDLLDEYYAAGHGNFRYEFIDPTAQETEEDKEKKKEIKRDVFGRAVREATSVEKELRGLGIPPVRLPSNEGDKVEVVTAYMGLAIHYGDKKEAIPVVQDTAGLEYDLTTLIRKLSRKKTPKVAFIGGHGGRDMDKDLDKVRGLLGELYDVSTLDLTKTPTIADDIDAIIVAGPKTPFSADEKRAIDGFVMQGKGAAFLLDAVQPDLSTLQPQDADSGLTDLLASYGVQVQPGLALDAECAQIPVMQHQGPFQIQQRVAYPFMPLAKGLDPHHPLTRGLSQVVFPFMSPLSIAFADKDGVKGDALASTSERGWVQQPPYDLNPFQRWTQDMITDMGKKNLLVTVTGALKSYTGQGTAKNGRVVVAGGSAFITDQFLSQSNEALALNLIDWLVLDEDLLAVRSRGLAAAPLDELSDGSRNTIKYLNIVGLPFAFVAFGLVRWRVREKRRREVSL